MGSDDVHPQVAVVGAGAWGVNHVRVFAELGALATICDPDRMRLETLEERYPDIARTPSVEDVLADPSISGVVLATPATTHAKIAGAALDAGKDVLVEKPMALTVEEADHLRDRAAGAGRILAVGHVLEYHPAILRLRELVSAGELGRVHYLYSNRLNFGTIRTEENVLWSFAPHDVAVMLRVVGANPESVTSHGGSYLNAAVADTTLTTLAFPGDVRAHIYVSWLHPFKEQRFVVVGDRRMVVFDDTAPWPEKLVAYDHAVDWADGRVPVARKVAGEAIPLEENEPLRLQAEAFLNAIVTRTPPLAEASSGVAVLKVLKAAQRSLESGGTPVSLETSVEVYVHPTATIDHGAQIGEGTKIWHHAHVMDGARVGQDCVLGQNVFVGRDVRIGDGCKIQNNVSVFEGVVLEDGVFCGPSVVFTNVRNPRAAVDRRGQFDQTYVKEGATLGANSVIVCGTTIGRYAFVAAGATVTKDVDDHALVAGSPARPIGWMCTCGERLTESLACQSCGRTYERHGTGLRKA